MWCGDMRSNECCLIMYCCRYSSSMKSLNNRYIHLTNYSINRSHSEYQSNSNVTVRQGHKWCVSSASLLGCVNRLREYFPVDTLYRICFMNIAYKLRMRPFDFTWNVHFIAITFRFVFRSTFLELLLVRTDPASLSRKNFWDWWKKILGPQLALCFS